MIEESYVSFDTARMLKEAGFDVPCNSYYELEDGEIVRKDSIGSSDYNAYEDTVCSRPTQELAARWLREVHNIHVVITEEAYVNGINYLWQVLIYNPLSVDCWDNKSTGMHGDNGEYEIYEEDLEVGLQEAIKLMKE